MIACIDHRLPGLWANRDFYRQGRPCSPVSTLRCVMTALLAVAISGCGVEVSRNLSQSSDASNIGKLVPGTSVELQQEMKVVFSRGEWYATLDDNDMAEIVRDPRIVAPPGIECEVRKMVPRAEEVEIKDQTPRPAFLASGNLQGKGCAISCTVQLKAGTQVRPGKHAVFVQLPGIDRLAQVTGMSARGDVKDDRPLRFRFRVVAWESPEARAAEERRIADHRAVLEQGFASRRQLAVTWPAVIVGSVVVVGLLPLVLIVRLALGPAVLRNETAAGPFVDARHASTMRTQTKCSECLGIVPAKATWCPHCGAPVE